MGRWYEGAKYESQCLRIELPYLLKNKYIVKGFCTKGAITWNDNSKVDFEASYTTEEKYIELSYTVSSNVKSSQDFKYRIGITTIPSNLGKGEIPFFICPATRRKCRILYMAYDSDKWFSRNAYNRRIYYRSQLDGSKMKECTIYFHLRDKIDKIRSKKNFHKYHKGQPTKALKRLQNMQIRKNSAAIKMGKKLVKQYWLINELVSFETIEE